MSVRNQRLNQSQVTVDKMSQRQHSKLSLRADELGLNHLERETFINENLHEYKKQDLVRLAVQDVRARGQQLDKKRKQQGKAYSAVKSKIAGNMKVIDRTNKELGYNLNRYQPKKTMSQSVA